MARDWIMAGHIIGRGQPLNSFAVSRAANSFDPDQTEPSLFAKKKFKNVPAEDKTDKFYSISVLFGLRDFVYFQNVMLFSEKCKVYRP